MIDSELPHARTTRLDAADRRRGTAGEAGGPRLPTAPPLPARPGGAWHDDPRRRAHG
jgi:hypothetical protein